MPASPGGERSLRSYRTTAQDVVTRLVNRRISMDDDSTRIGCDCQVGPASIQRASNFRELFQLLAEAWLGSCCAEFPGGICCTHTKCGELACVHSREQIDHLD